MTGRLHTRERAQAMVEFALVLPVLLLVVFAIFQLGYAWGRNLDLQSAAREGAREASVNKDAEDPILEAETAVADNLALSDFAEVDMTVTPPPPWDHGDTITVRLETPHEYSILGVSTYDGRFHAEAEIRVE